MPRLIIELRSAAAIRSFSAVSFGSGDSGNIASGVSALACRLLALPLEPMAPALGATVPDFSALPPPSTAAVTTAVSKPSPTPATMRLLRLDIPLPCAVPLARLCRGTNAVGSARCDAELYIGGFDDCCARMRSDERDSVIAGGKVRLVRRPPYASTAGCCELLFGEKPGCGWP